ncbi:hypothetical protein VP01_158g6 [Puccinia sorghi]|uniref:Uncharacterized protein n=1 Tax=Puccinia sorghi TaxID=27349 RepID=A0A0L6VI34_9BASI|nr:hypothetical protein VP01_158g6 [Puccinia sorghi]
MDNVIVHCKDQSMCHVIRAVLSVFHCVKLVNGFILCASSRCLIYFKVKFACKKKLMILDLLNIFDLALEPAPECLENKDLTVTSNLAYAYDNYNETIAWSPTCLPLELLGIPTLPSLYLSQNHTSKVFKLRLSGLAEGKKKACFMNKITKKSMINIFEARMNSKTTTRQRLLGYKSVIFIMKKRKVISKENQTDEPRETLLALELCLNDINSQIFTSTRNKEIKGTWIQEHLEEMKNKKGLIIHNFFTLFFSLVFTPQVMMILSRHQYILLSFFIFLSFLKKSKSKMIAFQIKRPKLWKAIQIYFILWQHISATSPMQYHLSNSCIL